jgi:hypothetical protein
MKWWHTVMLAMLVWGNAALANTTADVQSAQETQTIQKGVAHFNLNYPTLNVKIKALAEALKSPQSRQSLINQLQALDDYMHGDYVLPVGALKDIACGRPVCDGGGNGGKCHMCAIDDSQEKTPL